MDNLYRALKTTLDSSSFGLAQAGDIVEINDEVRAMSMVNDGQLEKVDMKNAKYFTKVEHVAEKAVEVPTVTEEVEEKAEATETVEEAPEKKAGRPKKSE